MYNRFNTPIDFEHLFDIFSVCFLQFRLVSKANPRKLNSAILSIYTSFVLSLRTCIRLLGIWETIYLVFRLFSNSLLIFSNSLILKRSSFINVSLLYYRVLFRSENLKK